MIKLLLPLLFLPCLYLVHAVDKPAAELIKAGHAKPHEGGTKEW